MMPTGLFIFGEYFTPLLMRSYLPREHVLHAIESRLARVEDIVLTPFEVVEEPYQLWVDLALQVAQGSKFLLEIIKAYGARYGRDWSREIEDAADKLSKAIEEATRLGEKAKPDFKPIRRELFEERLRLNFITKTPEMLSPFNWYDILNTTVHEAYPGHHVQLCYAKNAPILLRKTYFHPPDFIEGWAHYTEWLMLEEGIDRSLEYRLQIPHDALWRAVRVYVDVELSTGMITFEEAVEKLVKDAYLPQQGAIGEVFRYTLSPGYQISYNYGKTKILELREKVKKLLGEKYSHKLFHKLLLEKGNLPINILSEIVLEKAKKIPKLKHHFINSFSNTFSIV